MHRALAQVTRDPRLETRRFPWIFFQQTKTGFVDNMLQIISISFGVGCHSSPVLVVSPTRTLKSSELTRSKEKNLPKQTEVKELKPSLPTFKQRVLFNKKFGDSPQNENCLLKQSGGKSLIYYCNSIHHQGKITDPLSTLVTNTSPPQKMPLWTRERRCLLDSKGTISACKGWLGGQLGDTNC